MQDAMYVKALAIFVYSAI